MMRRYLLYFVLFGVLSAPVNSQVGEVIEALDIINLVTDVVRYLGKVWEEGFLQPTDMEFNPNWRFLQGGYNLSLDVASSTDIMEQFGRINERVSYIERSLTGIGKNIRELQDSLPSILRYELRLDRLLSYIQPIDSLYSLMNQYKLHQNSIENHTLLNFAESTVSHAPGSIQSLLGQIHSMVVPWMTGENGLFYHINNVLQSNTQHCNMRQSPQQLVHGLLKLILLAETKGYTMLHFSWMLLRSFGKGTFEREALLAKRQHEAMIKEDLKFAKETIQNASTEYWKCDPNYFFKGYNYVTLTRLLQGYIENEADMNEKGSCTSTCSSYRSAKQKRCYKGRKFQLCKYQQKCEGDIMDCKYNHADADVCFSSDPDRRYSWIEYENGIQLGSKETSCFARKKVDSWWRVFVHCSYCFCICDAKDAMNSDRYFSLRPSVADIKSNRIITGFQLQKRNRIIHIKVQTGVALASGEVDQSTVQWQEPKPMRVDGENVTEGVDYFKMSWSQRALDLDDLKAPAGHVITGVRFRAVGGHVGLMIQVVPVNFSSGELNIKYPSWISNDNTPASSNPRTLISLEDVDVPTKSLFQSWPDSKHDQYLHFTHTSIKLDAAQITVPYFDIQPVAPIPAVWLISAGLYHKGSAGYGGYVGLKASTIQLGPHIKYPDTYIRKSELPAEESPIHYSLNEI